jgi:hypothetical protein
MGTAESGHYYSLIKDRRAKGDVWYEFNDTMVRPFDVEDMAHEAFGGEEKVFWGGGTTSKNMIGSLREKFRNAYILFYERETFYDVHLDEGDKMPLLVPPTPSETPPTAVANIMSQVGQDNERYWLSRNTFSPEYFKFLMSVLKGYISRGAISFEMFKFFASFYLTIGSRAKDRTSAYDLSQILLKSMTQYGANWLLETLATREVHKEVLIDCPIEEMRKLVVVLLRKAGSLADQEVCNYTLQSMLNTFSEIGLAKKVYLDEFHMAIWCL